MLGVYVQADADFTAQLVYTAPDGSTLTKTLQVAIDRNATAEYPFPDSEIATFAERPTPAVTSGKITKYIPDTAATLNGTTGMCYDFSSLFAAMCRSEGIPCALTKGYAGSSYHAWNKVNLNGSWYQIDLTYAVTRNVRNAKTLHDCVSPLTYTNTSDTLAAEAA